MADANSSGQRVLTRDVEGISHSEWPVRFRAGQEEIFGILTEPLGPPRGIGVIVLNPTSDRNRFLARLARRLAGSGFHALRFDYRGFGESSGPFTESDLKHGMITLAAAQEPFTQDVLGAVAEFKRRGIEEIAVVGRCFGARTALSAVKHIRDLRGMALIALPLHRSGTDRSARRGTLVQVRAAARRGIRLGMLRGLFNPRRRTRWMRKLRIAAGQALRLGPPGLDGCVAEWLSEAVVESLRDAVSRRVPLLFMYGRAEPVYEDFLLARDGPLAPLLAMADDRVKVVLLDGPANTLTDLSTQEAVMTGVVTWLESRLGDVRDAS